MDNSDDAFRAAKRLIDLVKNSSSKRKELKQNNKIPEIIAFHSVDHVSFFEKIPIRAPSSFGASYSIPPVDYRKLQEEYELHGKKILKKTKDLFDKNNIEIETRLIKDEKAEDYIEKMVDEEKFELVVLGSKGEHSKLEQVFLGTIAQKVVNEVHCDVLVVR